jgi:hypothetical protein
VGFEREREDREDKRGKNKKIKIGNRKIIK